MAQEHAKFLLGCTSLSNYATTLIGDKKFEQAIVKLSQGLRHMTKHFRRPLDERNANTLSAGRSRGTQFPMFDIDTLCSTSSRKTRNHQRRKDDSIICKQPVRIPPILTRCEDAHSMIHVTMTYNLALAFHLMAINLINGNKLKNVPVLLRKASEAYRCTLDELQASNTIRCSKSIFYLQAMNNLADVYLKLGDGKKRKYCLEQLLAVTTLTTLSHRVDTSEYEKFLDTSISIVCSSNGTGAA